MSGRTLTWRWYHLYSPKKSLEGAVSTALYAAMLFSSPVCQIPRCKLDERSAADPPEQACLCHGSGS